LSRVEYAFKELVSRLPIILPVIIISVVAFLLELVLLRFFPSPLTNAVVYLIEGIAFSLEAGMAFSGYIISPRLSDEISDVNSRLGSVIALGVVLGVFLLVFSFLPLSLLFDALSLSFLFLSYPFVYRSRLRGVGEALNWLSNSLQKDPLSFLVIYIASFLSFFPVADILAIPYAVILSYVLYREV